jgi:hypothetical protein
VARIYWREFLPKPIKEATFYEPAGQELFYDWVLTLEATQRVGGVYITIRDDDKQNYRLHVDPEGASVSDVSPGWISGFPEPREPDFYSRSIKFESLIKTSTITIRRPMRLAQGTNKIDAFAFPVGSYDVSTSEPCTVTKSDPYNDDQKRLMYLMVQFQGLSSWKWGRDKKPAKIWLNPDEARPELQPDEFEQTLEAQCEDDACNKLTLTKMTARLKREQRDTK